MRHLAPLVALPIVLSSSQALATGGDGWPAMAHDAYRTARSTGTGSMATAPQVAWRRKMGGALADNQAAVADVDGDGVNDVVMVSAGRVVARHANDVGIWKSDVIGASRVIGTFDLDGKGNTEVLAVGTSPVGLYVLSAKTGATLWYESTPTTAIDALAIPNPAGGKLLYLTQQLGPTIAYQFASGIASPAANQAWQGAAMPWSVDLAAGDVDGDGKLDLVRGADRGFIVYDASTGAVKCDASNLVANTNAPVYFPAFSALDVDGDGRAEVVLYDYSYYYSEDAGIYVVSCNGAGPALTPVTRWKQQWINDITSGPGNDVNRTQVLYLADAVVNLDNQGPLEMVYSFWSQAMSSWTTFVVNASTGAVLAQQAGMVLEGVADVDGDGKPDVLMRDANGIGAIPKPFFSTLRAYGWMNGALADKGWTLTDARAATVGGWRSALVTSGAGAVLARQNVNGAADPAAEAYVFQKHQNAAAGDVRPGNLLAVHGADGNVLYKYAFPDGITGAVLTLAQNLEAPPAPAESLVMLTDGGLRVLDDQLLEANKLLPGNHARLVTVAPLDGTHQRILAVDSSDALVALDGTLLDPTGVPVTAWQVRDAMQGESRGYVNAPGLVLPQPGGGAVLVAEGHSNTSFEETALMAVKSDGSLSWKTDVGTGWQVPGFENFEVLDDLDGDGVADFFLTELDPLQAQQLVVKKGADGTTMVSRAVGDLFPPSGVYLQGHAAVDVNGDGKLDVVSALHGSWFVAIDVSKAGGGDPLTGFAQIFRAANGPNGQAMVGDLDGMPGLDLVRVASQNAFGAYEQRALATGVVQASYQPPTLAVAGSDANTAALAARPGAAGKRDLVWSGMAGTALGAVARVDGQSMTEKWFAYLSGGNVFPKAAPPATRTALYEPVVADVDGDGNDEVLVGADDGYLYALRVADGSLLWSVDLGAPVVHTVPADVDKDVQIEILCALADGTLVALDAAGGYVADQQPKPMPDAGPDGAGGGSTMTGTGGGSASSSSSSGSGSSSSGGGAVGAGGGTTGAGGEGGGGGSANTNQKGGCGCRVADADGGGAGLVALLGIAALAARRPRRRRSGRTSGSAAR